ncbi:hypothetical protein DKX38_024344 [Salix brachista]|uniref:V-SNARE coiled-coil homology domain-containing protein n=1 Tax=Salix brachista TaxID=2182728 RepID=A0A5N5JSA6_9ROSI|nr:hypothetical protein DKX38_024344 [Salix brachista]
METLTEKAFHFHIVKSLFAQSNKFFTCLIVHTLPQGKGPPLRAVFSLLNSPILALQFANYGAKLAVGLECGHVVVLDTSSLAVLFTTESVSSSCSPVISVNWVGCINTCSLVKSPKHSDSNMPITPTEQVMFFLTKDATLYMIDGGTGSMISSHPWHPKKKSVAISMYVIGKYNLKVEVNKKGIPSVPDLTDGKQLEESGQILEAKNESEHTTNSTGISSHNNEHHSSVNTLTRERLLDSFILLCCVDSLQLYSTKNVIQGNNKAICKVKHAKPCCWASTFRKEGNICGVVLLFQSGIIEIRSFSGLELVKETSLMSILRWNFKANMEKMMSCDNGQITLAHGCELAFISLFSGENFSRIPESFPCLHDKVLAAAADAAFNFSSNQKKQGIKPGILDGIVKGFKGRKVDHSVVINPSPKSDVSHLEAAFSKQPFSDSYRTAVDNEEVVELHIDDIEIDEPSLPTATTSSQEVKHMKREKRSQREQLLGVTDDMKPKLRTPEEIMAKYRKAEDASSVAAHAREKLLERQEKLEGPLYALQGKGSRCKTSRYVELIALIYPQNSFLFIDLSQFLCFLHRNRYENTGPAHMATKSSHEAQSKKREKRDGRENLLGFGDETKHRSRNLKEIVSKYRKYKDPSSLAMSAKNKLVQRQEKLDKLSNQAEELEGTSEDYASMTNELLNKMEKRKWWQI